MKSGSISTDTSSAFLFGNRTVKPYPWLVLFLSVLFLFSVCSISWAEPDTSPRVSSKEQKEKQQKLWGEAQTFLEEKDNDKAALYFKHFWKTYPDSPRAAEALWQASLLYKQQALQAENPDWVKVKDLFYAYIIDFPNSPRVADAYFEVGNSFFQMAFYREAQNYYTLLLKEYPEFDQKNQAVFMRARAYLYMGKYSLASDEFSRLQRHKDKMIRLQGEVGQADVHFFKGEWHNTLGILKRIHNHNPDYYLIYPKIFKDMGIASIRVGNIQEGRDYILHYLNIAEQAQSDDEAFFEVAESFLLEGMVDGARVFYERVVARDARRDKYVILSQFRLAQYGAINLDKMSEKERLAFFKKNGDKPFQKVLDNLYRDPLAQEARYSLFQRYVERKEWELAYNLGKSYLRYKTKKKEKVLVEDALGEILISKISKLLEAKKYEEVRSLYEKEFPTITSYRKAGLLMLVGEAYEADSLYDQASVIYYRALGLEIGDEQKAKLYFRRAEVYLANNDLKSAQRLLKYLRRLYQDQPAIAEVNWLSARLRNKQKRTEDALEFYKMAVEAGDESSKKDVYATDYLHHLFAVNDISRVADLIAMFHNQQWLPAEKIQFWYGRLGVVLVEQGEREKAMAIYKKALAGGLPEKSAEAQPIHLHLGDLLMVEKRHKAALGHYQLALAGKDKRIAKLAQSRLNEYEIRSAISDVKAML